jgi:heme/copper-type cytochrome/quinol oxidase subunit 2
MSLLTVLLILAVFGIVFLLVVVAVVRMEADRERTARSSKADDGQADGEAVT